MASLLSWINDNNWIVHIFGIVLATVLTNFILRRVLNRLQQKTTNTSNLWDDAVIEAGRKPLLLFVWVVGVSLAAEVIELSTDTPNDIFQYTGLARQIAIIVLLMMFLVKLISKIEQNIIKNKALKDVDADEVTVRVLGRLLRISVLITGTLVVLQTLGISISGVLAFGGIGGVAVGFAAKDLLANFFGGLMIYLDRPFSIGDWVSSPDRNIEGTVEDIGWRLTKIRTFDKRPLYIPNSMFNTIIVENPSRMSNRRIYETIGLRYCDSAKMGDIVDAVKTMLLNHEEIDSTQTLIVNFDAMAASSLDFFVYTFTKTTEWVRFHEIKQDVLLKIIAIIHDHDADIAFPTRTLDGLDSLQQQ
ncbi:MAG: mechanosensitive ion channel family protein [Gammaproteobacteria bacterium]|nr:mechanosensitive ion channel family protein [Gammaproteobacteria bacterium]